ncbi:MAG: hypothetical protein VZR09_06270 [Candidatus Gastranaerophilaceae bacterium]|nr:hypothetical protein [Candidatus Gastranaerophilaceae bacterium]
MKKILLVVAVLAMSLPVVALDVKESTSIQFMDNYGYSDALNNYVQQHKANANGLAYYPNSKFRPELKYYGHNRVWNGIVSGTRSFFDYIDPAEEGGVFNNKDIKFYTNTKDAR